MYYKIVVPGPEPGTYLSCHGGTHTWVPGVTYGPVPVHPCYTGFHACRARDLSTWLVDGMVVFEVELTDVVEAHDKVVGSTATLGRCLGTITREGMAEFARRGSERANGYAATAHAASYAVVAADAADAAADARTAALAADALAASYAVVAADAADAAAEAARAADYAATAHAASYAVAAADAAEAAAEAAGGFGARYAAGSADYAARAAAARSEREQQGRDILSLLG